MAREKNIVARNVHVCLTYHRCNHQRVGSEGGKGAEQGCSQQLEVHRMGHERMIIFQMYNNSNTFRKRVGEETLP